MKSPVLLYFGSPFVKRGVLLVIAFVAVQAAHSQNKSCEEADGRVFSCPPGGSCGFGFGEDGLDLYERFTLRITDPGIPQSPESLVRVIVEIGGVFRDVQVGYPDFGNVFYWTKMSGLEGETLFVVLNEGGGNIRSALECRRADTGISLPAEEGDQTLIVADTSPFAVGDTVVVDPGGPTEEINVVVGFGSLLLETPLQFAHAAGEIVVSRGPGPIATASEATPTPPRFDVRVLPNPSWAGTTVSLTLDTGQNVSLTVFDGLGRRLALLHDGPLAAGSHALQFEARGLPGGVYFIRAIAGHGTQTRTVTLLR